MRAVGTRCRTVPVTGAAPHQGRVTGTALTGATFDVDGGQQIT